MFCGEAFALGSRERRLVTTHMEACYQQTIIEAVTPFNALEVAFRSRASTKHPLSPTR